MKALVPVADGTEEIEAVTIANVLARAGISVTLSSVGPSTTITGARGIKLVANELITESRSKVFDLITLPGGMPGAEHLRDSKDLIAMLKEQQKSGRHYAAICASPSVVLDHHGLLEGVNACCYPCFKLKGQPEPTNARVIVSGKVVTSVGPATAMEFALKLVEVLKGQGEAKKVADGLLFQGAL